VGSVGASYSRSTSKRRSQRQTLARLPRCPKRDPLDTAHRSALEKDLPERYPPYQTCHRRFQKWIEEGVLGTILEALAKDLEERGEIDLSECYIDGTFVVAKKGGRASERP
jgi:transposase